MEEMLKKFKELDIYENKPYIFYDELKNKFGKRYEDIKNNNLDVNEFVTHSPSCIKLFNVLNELNIKNGDNILDIGSGKGFAIFIFTLFNFSKIDGVEINNNDFTICERNIASLDLKNRINVYNCDILEFDLLNNYNYFYLYNPFGKDIFEKLVEKMSRLVNITIIYKNIHNEEIGILYKYGFYLFKEIEGDERNYFIFKDILL